MINAAVVVIYLFAMVLLGLYLARFVRRDEDFFMAGRSLNRWVVAGSIMATNVAAIYLVGPAAAAYAGGGVAVLLIGWTGNMIAAMSALVFVPRLRRLEITTVSEFLEQRYGLWIRLLPSALWIIYYSLFSGNAIYTMATVLQPITVDLLPAADPAQSGGLSVNTIILVVGGGVTLYCAFSGLVAVAYTSVIQAFLIVIGGLILLPLTLKHMGGISGFSERVPAEFFIFWKTGDGAPWPTYRDVIMFCLLGLPYWCTSQYMLQRSFAGRTVREASKGLILAALLTGPLTLTYLVPGICAAVIYSGDNALANKDLVLPQLLMDILPIGLGGLFIAGLMAASNSTASALLNSLATLAEHDFYRRFIPNRASSHYVWVGRLATVAGGALGLVFAFNVDRLGGIMQANFELMTFFEPPIFVIVAAALFWRYINATGAGIALIVGIVFNTMASFGWGLEPMTMDVRIFITIPLCTALLLAGSVLGGFLFPRTGAEEERINQIMKRIRSDESTGSRPAGGLPWLGIGVAAACLAAFVLCAVFEASLPKPGTILINLGLMTGFILGCYLALPIFVPEEDPPETGEVEKTALEKSWVHVIFGSGRSWLVLYLLAAVLMVVLYFI